MKTLKFSDELVALILRKEKNTTWRIADEKNITTGDELSLLNNNGKEFARVIVTSSQRKSFFEVDHKDKEGHENFLSDEEMYKTYSHYYGFEVTPTTLVTIIKFKIL